MEPDVGAPSLPAVWQGELVDVSSQVTDPV